MYEPPAELAARYATRLAEYLPDSRDRAALTEIVANSIWCPDEIAAALTEALLGVVEAVTFAVHDAVDQGECETERFRGWIAASLEALAEQIAAVERSISAIAPGVGHA